MPISIPSKQFTAPTGPIVLSITVHTDGCVVHADPPLTPSELDVLDKLLPFVYGFIGRGERILT